MTVEPNRSRGAGTSTWAGLLPVERPQPGKRRAADGSVRGRCVPPPSKSLLQRALVLASRATGTTRLVGIGRRELAHGDVAAACAAARVLGAELERSGEDLLIRGVEGGSPWSPAAAALDAGESGTLARMLTALAALLPPAGQRTRVVARGTLRRRASPALARALERAGASWIPSDGAQAAGWPAQIISAPIEGEPTLALDAPGSSQELTALLVALAARGAPARVELSGVLPSRPYLELTCACLADFGVTLEVERECDRERYLLKGELCAPSAPWTVEPDASTAAVALAAAALSGGELVVPGLDADARQGDVRIAEHLAAFGCESSARNAALAVRSGPSRGADLELSGEPDLAPVLAAVAAAAALRAGATSRLSGLGTLPGKESDRLATLAAGLRAAGLGVELGPESLVVAPGAGRSADAPPLLLDPAGDHRMAFAFALLGLVLPGIRVADPGCVAKSWPDFWEDLEQLGARVERSPRVHPASAAPGPGRPGRGARPAGG